MNKAVNIFIIFLALCGSALSQDYISPQLEPKPPREFFGEWYPVIPGLNPAGIIERTLPFPCFRIEGDWIRRSGYVNLGDFLDTLPGIRAEEIPGCDGKLEGYSGKQPVIMIDGFYLQPSSGSLFELNSIPLENIAYVEVYQGPLVGLYADCTEVVNIVTRHQRVEQADAYIMAADGSFDLERYKFAFSYSLPHYDFTVSGNRLLFRGYETNRSYSGGNLALSSNLNFDRFSSLGGFSWSGVSKGGGGNLPLKEELGLTRLWLAPRWKVGSWLLGGEFSYHRESENNKITSSPFIRLDGLYSPEGGRLGWYSSLQSISSPSGDWEGRALSSLGVSLTRKFNLLTGLQLEVDEQKNYRITPTAGLSLLAAENINLFTNLGFNYHHPSDGESHKGYSLLAGGRLYFLNRGQFYLACFYQADEDNDSVGGLGFLQFRLPGNFLLANSFSIQNHPTPQKPKFVLYSMLAFNPSFKKGKFSLYSGVEHTYNSSGANPFHQYSPVSDGELPDYHLWDLRFSVRVLSVEVFMLIENLLDKRIITPYGQLPGYPRLYRVGFSWSFLN